MERGVVTERNYILRYLGSFWSEGERYLMFEPVVTLEMAERMRREAEMAKVKASSDVPASSKGVRLRGKEVSAVPHDRGAKAKG